MKKLLIGCGVVMLVCVLFCVGTGLWGFMSFRRTVKGYEQAVAKLDAVSRRHPYQRPTDNLLTPERMERFLGLREFVIAQVQNEPVVKKLLEADAKRTRPSIGTWEMISFIMKAPPRVMTGLAEELDRKNMSPEEYLDTGRLIFVTIGRGHRDGNLAMTKYYDELNQTVTDGNKQLTAGGPQTAQHTVNLDQILLDLDGLDDVPAENYTVLEAYRSRLMEFPQLFFIEFVILNQLKSQGIVVK
jgi:hypothetical protein